MLPYTAFDITRIMTSGLAELANQPDGLWPAAHDRPSHVRRLGSLLRRQLRLTK